jgi:hypothetical protein
MDMKPRILAAAAALFALGAAPATGTEYYSYRCSNSTVLRVIFNEERGAATVVPYARPSIRLTRAEATGGGFRYTRRTTHELSGSLEEVRWRVGQAEWTCRHGGG